MTERSDYARMKEDARRRNAEKSKEGRDIGDLPPVEDTVRKERAKFDFKYFCEKYFPNTFNLGWSPDHLKVLDKTKQAVTEGGLFALAMPRGNGKSTIAETAAIWSLVFGHRRFVALIGATEDHAANMLDSIKTELETNDFLLEDFPEVCYPIRCLEGISHRANGQTYRGERTHITWTAKELILPTIENYKTSGSIVKVAGITGRVRGMKHKTAQGETIRPTLVIVDDPQTDESAKSPSQSKTRESILAGAILGLAGAGNKISGIMPCTVICENDMAYNILDKDKHPEWNGEKMKMVYDFPDNEDLWDQYNEIRVNSLKEGKGITLATEFYKKNKAEMDKGSRVAWEERFNHDELSALQNAMNLKFQDEAAFYAEYQNEPIPDKTAELVMLTKTQIVEKTNRIDRGVVPVDASHLVAFVDVQKACLFYVIAAFCDDFTGAIIDYGAYPKQPKQYFSISEVKNTYMEMYNKGFEGSLYQAIQDLLNSLINVEYPKEGDSGSLTMSRVMVDANWGESTDIVYKAIRESDHKSIVIPSHGVFVGASTKPFSEYKKKPGDILGHNCRIVSTQTKRGIRYCTYDTNYWKSFFVRRMAAAHGEVGSMALFGKHFTTHEMIADHILAEYKIQTTGRGRTVDEWKIRPNNPDNHLFDCAVGCCVLGSIVGCQLPDADMLATKVKKQKQISLSELQAKKRRNVRF